MFREVQQLTLGYTQQDVQDYEAGIDALRSAGQDRLADGVERFVSALMVRQPHPAPLQSTVSSVVP